MDNKIPCSENAEETTADGCCPTIMISRFGELAEAQSWDERLDLYHVWYRRSRVGLFGPEDDNIPDLYPLSRPIQSEFLYRSWKVET